MLSATGILNPSMSLEVSVGRAANSLNYDLQMDNLFRSAAGLSGDAAALPGRRPGGLHPRLPRSAAAARGNAGFYQTDRGPFTNENITWDALANLTKICGSHSAKFGVYFQNSYKPQSMFASFNSQIDFIDDANNPFDTGYSYANAATGVFNTYTQATKFAVPDWKYKNFEWYAQDNWKVNRRCTLDYGVRFYYMTPQWDTTLQASNFLPDQFDPASAAQPLPPRLHRRLPLLAAANRRGMDPRLVAQGVTPTHGEHGRRPLHRPPHARLEPLQRRLPGRPGHQRPAAGRQHLQGLAALRLRLRHHRQGRDDRPRRRRRSSTTGRRATRCST